MAKKHLVIVESPAKAKTIGKYLGKDYEVKASMGHLRDLAEYLLEKENISGEEFQRILSQQDEKITPLPAGGETAV